MKDLTCFNIQYHIKSSPFPASGFVASLRKVFLGGEQPFKAGKQEQRQMISQKYQKMLKKLDELETMFILAVTILIVLKEKGRLPQAVEALESMAGEA